METCFGNLKINKHNHVIKLGVFISIFYLNYIIFYNIVKTKTLLLKQMYLRNNNNKKLLFTNL